MNLEKYFTKKELLDQALTHKSWVNENKGVRKSNERLEFLGDAVLEFVISNELFKKFPNKDEGYLTALRANLVNKASLSEIAHDLNLGTRIFLSKGEEATGGRTNKSLLEDTLEAIIGAIYLDSGLEIAHTFILDTIFSTLADKLREPLKDAKSRLQELVQSDKLPTPFYKVVSEEGPDHGKKFLVEVHVDNKKIGSGSGNSKNSAEQAAATNALEKRL